MFNSIKNNLASVTYSKTNSIENCLRTLISKRTFHVTGAVNEHGKGVGHCLVIGVIQITGLNQYIALVNTEYGVKVKRGWLDKSGYFYAGGDLDYSDDDLEDELGDLFNKYELDEYICDSEWNQQMHDYSKAVRKSSIKGAKMTRVFLGNPGDSMWENKEYHSVPAIYIGDVNDGLRMLLAVTPDNVPVVCSASVGPDSILEYGKREAEVTSLYSTSAVTVDSLYLYAIVHAEKLLAKLKA